MNKICTSLEQSKRLIELGIDRKSSDMYYWCGSDLRIGGYKAQDEDFDIPAWSITALLSVLPSVINRKGERMFLTLEKAGAYNLYYKSPNRLDELWETKEDVVDACYEMILELNRLNLL